MVAPKPFPFPIGIGTDVCQINRIADILRDEYKRNRWARKLFTRLEWPALCDTLQRAEGQAEVRSDQRLENEEPAIAKDCDNEIWMLPRLSRSAPIFEDDNTYWSAIADQRSPLGKVVRRLAGRWAAKEAAIKAHRHRRLYMKDISIVKPSPPPGLSEKAIGGDQKLIALIDPPSDRISMSPRVATQRGLRGFVSKSYGLHKGALMTRDEPRKERESEGWDRDKSDYYHRGSRVRDSDRQVAEINISHDGDYAIAVCMAFDPSESTFKQKTTIDRGKGLPLHEPQWGDEGWFDLPEPELEEGSSKIKKNPVWDMPLANLLDELKSPPDPDAFKKTFKHVFENSNVPPLP